MFSGIKPFTARRARFHQKNRFGSLGSAASYAYMLNCKQQKQRRPNHRKQRNGGDDLGAVRAVGVACARWAWRQRENCTVNSFFRKKAKDKRKTLAVQM